MKRALALFLSILAWHASARAECTLKSDNAVLPAVQVAAQDGTLHTVDLGDPLRSIGVGHVQLTLPSRQGQPDVIRVSGGIEFVATRKWTRFPVTQPLVAAEGTVRLLPGALFTYAYAKGDTVWGRVPLTESIQADYYHADEYVDEFVAKIAVPCAALRLVEVTDIEGNAVGDAECPGENCFPSTPTPARYLSTERRREGTVWLRPSPTYEVDAVSYIRFEQAFTMGVLEERRGWVLASYPEPSSYGRIEVVGWIPRSFFTNRVIGIGSRSDGGEFWPFPPRCDLGTPKKLRTVRFRPGTALYASATNTSRWATLTEETALEIDERAFAPRISDWVGAYNVLGIRSGTCSPVAWLARADIIE